MATLEVSFSFERWSFNVSLSSDGEKHKITHIRWFSLTENQIIWCEWEQGDMKLTVWTHHFHLPDCSETRMNKKCNIKYTIMLWYVPEMAYLEWYLWCVYVRIVTLLSLKQTAAAAHRATISRTPHTRQTHDFEEPTLLLDTITCGKGSAPWSRNWLSRSIIIVSVSPPKAQVKLCLNIRNCRLSVHF